MTMRYTGERWTLAQIKDKNMRAGWYFFSRDTMKFFGDTMRSFAVRHEMIDGRPVILIERVRPMHDHAGRNMGGLGDLRVFDPETGDIGVSHKSMDEIAASLSAPSTTEEG